CLSIFSIYNYFQFTQFLNIYKGDINNYQYNNVIISQQFKNVNSKISDINSTIEMMNQSMSYYNDKINKSLAKLYEDVEQLQYDVQNLYSFDTIINLKLYNDALD